MDVLDFISYLSSVNMVLILKSLTGPKVAQYAGQNLHKKIISQPAYGMVQLLLIPILVLYPMMGLGPGPFGLTKTHYFETNLEKKL